MAKKFPVIDYGTRMFVRAVTGPRLRLLNPVHILASDLKRTIFWNITLESVKAGDKQSTPPAFTLVSCSAYFSTLKMEAICSSETSVDSQRTARRYTRIPEDGTLHNHRCENLKSYIASNLFKTQCNTLPPHAPRTRKWSLPFIFFA
jgi:hypothetical protein